MGIEFTTLYNKDCVNDLLCGWVESTALDDTQICVYTNKKNWLRRISKSNYYNTTGNRNLNTPKATIKTA